MHYIYLGIAIVAEVAGTTALKWSDGMSKLVPSVVVVIAYSIAFYSLSLALRTFSVGIAYAIWAGLGMVLIAILGVVVFKERLDLAAYVGIGLIIAGVMVLNLVSESAPR